MICISPVGSSSEGVEKAREREVLKVTVVGRSGMALAEGELLNWSTICVKVSTYPNKDGVLWVVVKGDSLALENVHLDRPHKHEAL